jgi:hypothetical protein
MVQYLITIGATGGGSRIYQPQIVCPHLYIQMRIFAFCSPAVSNRIHVENREGRYMPKGEPRTFWIGVMFGLIVALIINYLITIGGAFVGGFIAAWFAGGGTNTGGKAGVYTGLLNALVLAVVIAVLGIEAAPGDLILLQFLGSTVFVTLMLIPLLALMGYLGGVLGGVLKGR